MGKLYSQKQPVWQQWKQIRNEKQTKKKLSLGVEYIKEYINKNI